MTTFEIETKYHDTFPNEKCNAIASKTFDRNPGLMIS